MRLRLGLAARTVPGVAPHRLVELAAAARLQHIGVAFDAAEDWRGRAASELRQRATDAGVQILDVEPVRIREGGLPAHLPQVLDVAAELGASFVLVIGHDAPDARTVELFRTLCEQAWSKELRAALEFMPFRGVRTLGDALSMVRAASHPAGCVLVDNHHLARSGGSIEDLAAVPPQVVGYAQLCDVPGIAPGADAEAIMQEALERRTLPGTASLPCHAFLAALPPATPVSVEILGPRLRAGYASDHAYVAALRDATLALG